MTTQARRQREKERRRRDILSAARQVFREKGFDGASVPEIADKAELAAGTLYLYFPNKHSLYIELLAEGYDLLIERLKPVNNSLLDGREKADAMMRAVFEFAAEYPEYFDIIFFVAQKSSHTVQEIFAHEEQEARLAEKEATAKGLAASALDPSAGQAGQVAVDAVWSMLVGLLFYFRKNEREIFDSVAGKAREIILRGLYGD